MHMLKHGIYLYKYYIKTAKKCSNGNEEAWSKNAVLTVNMSFA